MNTCKRLQDEVVLAHDIPDDIRLRRGFNLDIAEEGANFFARKARSECMKVFTEFATKMSDTQGGTVAEAHRFANWEVPLEFGDDRLPQDTDQSPYEYPEWIDPREDFMTDAERRRAEEEAARGVPTCIYESRNNAEDLYSLFTAAVEYLRDLKQEGKNVTENQDPDFNEHEVDAMVAARLLNVYNTSVDWRQISATQDLRDFMVTAAVAMVGGYQTSADVLKQMSHRGNVSYQDYVKTVLSVEKFYGIFGDHPSTEYVGDIMEFCLGIFELGVQFPMLFKGWGTDLDACLSGIEGSFWMFTNSCRPATTSNTKRSRSKKADVPVMEAQIVSKILQDADVDSLLANHAITRMPKPPPPKKDDDVTIEISSEEEEETGDPLPTAEEAPTEPNEDEEMDETDHPVEEEDAEMGVGEEEEDDDVEPQNEAKRRRKGIRESTSSLKA
eukprot:s3012_g6.t1